MCSPFIDQSIHNMKAEIEQADADDAYDIRDAFNQQAENKVTPASKIRQGFIRARTSTKRALY